ncbi:MAG: tetratricopeptide repeat protein [Myxococcota bacterium]
MARRSDLGVTRGSGLADGPGAGPSGMGPLGMEPSGMEPSGMGPSGMDPSGMGPSGMGPSGMDPSGMGPSGMAASSEGPPTLSVSGPRARAVEVAVGTTIGRFVIDERIGAGGMGQVFRAHDPQLERAVALKVLHHHTDDQDRVRLSREAQAMAALNHPNIVPIFDVGTVTISGSKSSMFIAMELVEGQTLDRWCHGRRRRRRLDEILAVFRGAGDGLRAAHEAGLVHRDFKPSNVMIDRNGRARVLDFGLARAMVGAASDTNSAYEVEQSLSRSVLSDSMTMTGLVVGTPAYMAPEQHAGQELDPRCDQYAFCVTLWEAIYGWRPFGGDDLKALYAAKRAGRPRVSAMPRQPRALRRIFARGLAADPDARFETMAALLRQLETVRPRPRRWPVMVGAGGATLGLAVAAYGWAVATNSARCPEAPTKLAGIWDRATKAELAAAFEETGLAYASDTWSRVEVRVDDYAARWVAAYARACEAVGDRARHEQQGDQRMRCLEERLGYLRALGQTWANTGAAANAAVVQRATTAVEDLPEPEACDDEDYVGRRSPGPDDPAIRLRVGQLRDELRQVWALEQGGRYAEGLERVRRLEAEAEATGYSPVLVEVALATGSLEQRLGRFEEAARSLRKAYFDAKAQGLDDFAARAAVQLVYVVGQELGRVTEALDVWAKHAQTAVERIDDAVRRSVLLNILGILHRNRGDYDKALSYHRQAQAQLAEVEDLGSRVRSGTTTNALTGIGLALLAQGEYEPAIEYLQRVLTIRRTMLGPLHPLIATAVTNIGMAYSKQGDYPQALEYQREALALYQQSLEPRHPSIVDTRFNLAITYGRMGDYDSALEHHLEVLTDFEALYGPEHRYVGDSLYSIGLAYGHKQDHLRAAEYYGRALVVFEHALGPEHPHVADTLTGIGNARRGQGDASGAIAPLERAVSILEQGEAAPEIVATVHFSLARALAEAGREPERARTLALRAREGYVNAERTDAAWVAEVDAWLAKHR